VLCWLLLAVWLRITLVKSLLIFLSLFLTAGIFAETRYVSDELTIFIRTGPTHQFRIVGTLTAGDAVEILADDADNKATQVRLDTGREVWVDTDQLMAEKPNNVLLREKTVALQKLTSSCHQVITRAIAQGLIFLLQYFLIAIALVMI